MYRSQKLAVKYLAAAIILFGIMTLAGLMSAYYYINPDFLFGILHFNIAKILHIDTIVIWLLMGFMGAIYWFLPEELGRELVGIGWPRFFLCLLSRGGDRRRRFHRCSVRQNRPERAVVHQSRQKICRSAALGCTWRRRVMAVFGYNVIGTASPHAR